MGFFAAIGSCFGKYATFSGRASRSEFWYFVLFFCLLAVPAALLGLVAAVVIIPLALPAISVEVRRLHDTDRSGWWFWIGAIPVIGLIKLFWYCGRGTEGENRFGPDPLTLIPSAPVTLTVTPTASMTEKAEQLAKIKTLLDAATITQDEFDRMKADVLAS